MKVIKDEIIDKMKELKLKGLKISEIAKICCVSDRSVNKYTKGISHPKRRLFILKEDAKKLDENKANILGYLSAEGCEINFLSKFKNFDIRRGKSYLLKHKVHRIIFTNKNEIIQNHFLYLMKTVYGYKPTLRPNSDIFICAKAVVNDLIRYQKFGSRKWNIPFDILQGNLNLKVAWLRGYGDGDGTVDFKKREVNFKSVNFKGLKSVQNLLTSIGIHSHIRGPYDGAYVLVIDDKERYKNLINFNQPDKKSKLEKICEISKPKTENRKV